MATLHVKAKASAGVRNYTIGIDEMPVALDESGEGDIDVDGSCGDGSQHTLAFDFEGGIGDTLSATVSCNGTEVCALQDAVTVNSDPFGAGTQDFRL